MTLPEQGIKQTKSRTYAVERLKSPFRPPLTPPQAGEKAINALLQIALNPDLL